MRLKIVIAFVLASGCSHEKPPAKADKEATEVETPTAGDDVADVPELQSTNIAVLVNDGGGSDTWDNSSLTVLESPVNGVATVNPDGTVDYKHNGPGLDDTFTYAISNDEGATTEPARVQVTVDPCEPCSGSFEVEDSDALMRCSTVSGSVDIRESSLQNLGFLGCLTVVGRDLTIVGNGDLVDLSALARLEAVQGDLVLVASESLPSLQGLERLERVEGKMQLTSLGVDTLMPLQSLTTVGETMSIDFAERLTDLAGLEALESVGSLKINNNARLESLHGLDALETIPGELTIAANSALQSLDGLQSLLSIGDELRIEANYALVDLSGLGALNEVGSNLNINYNSALPNVDGLTSLYEVGNNVELTQNDALIRVDGLSAVSRVGGDVVVEWNELLCESDAESWAFAIPDVGGDVDVEGNLQCP